MTSTNVGPSVPSGGISAFRAPASASNTCLWLRGARRRIRHWPRTRGLRSPDDTPTEVLYTTCVTCFGFRSSGLVGLSIASYRDPLAIDPTSCGPLLPPPHPPPRTFVDDPPGAFRPAWKPAELGILGMSGTLYWEADTTVVVASPTRKPYVAISFPIRHRRPRDVAFRTICGAYGAFWKSGSATGSPRRPAVPPRNTPGL